MRMGESKGKKGVEGVPQRHLHSRISYLFQASHYLSARTKPSEKQIDNKISKNTQYGSLNYQGIPSQCQSRHLTAQLKGVARKSQIRLSREVKRSICKRCGALLLPGQTSSQALVNGSKGGRKPWADVYEVRCLKCQAVKRFPGDHKPSRAGEKQLAPTERDGNMEEEIS
jgi:ribonuclease P protein subunit RPR2